MRILLVHNRKAGNGRNSEPLEAAIGEAGHEVTLIRRHRDDLSAALRTPHDLIVIAGGDGTVSRVLEEQRPPRAPIAILAHGSANDLAEGLGLTPAPSIEALPQIARGWETAPRRRFDLGRAEGTFGAMTIVESAGAGALSHALRCAHEEDRGEEDKIAYGRRRVAEILREGSPLCTASLDGGAPVRDLALCEVLTAPVMGPRLRLAPDADPGDGLFDVLLAGEAGAHCLAAWIEAGAEGPPPLSVQRAKTVALDPGGGTFRIDDDFPEAVGQVLLTAGQAVAEILCGNAR